MIIGTAAKMLEMGYVCDHCLGRQFAKLMRGGTNVERGRIIRDFMALEYESGELKAEPSNFHCHFHAKRNETDNVKPRECVVCGNVFENLGKLSADALKKLEKMDFENFMIGVKMNDSLVMKEESLWEKMGIKHSEPIKTEINRELTNIISSATGSKTEPNSPDVIIIIDLQKKQTEILSNPLFVYGNYKKFERGLPQTSSPLYKQTVQDIISKPLVKQTSASSNVLHALGREDKDARCLVWRPFVLELKHPLRRKVNLRKISSEINKSEKVKVRSLRFSGRKEIIAIKSSKPYKVYMVIVEFEEPVEKIDDAKKIVGVVRQMTPARILGRKEDRTKHKKVKSIKWKRINSKTYQFEITAESGLYLHELVSGDSGRTRPSIAQLLVKKAKIREFDLIGFEE
jgi:tRNA pseudouridine synthase 10